MSLLVLYIEVSGCRGVCQGVRWKEVAAKVNFLPPLVAILVQLLLIVRASNCMDKQPRCHTSYLSLVPLVQRQFDGAKAPISVRKELCPNGDA